MDKFDRYFKSKHYIDKRLINTYTGYDKHWLLSNGYSIVMTNTCNTCLKENEILGYSIIEKFNRFIDKNINTYIETIDLDTIKNNLTDKSGYNASKVYNYNKDYSIDYMLLKKIIDIIGCKKINIIDSSKYANHDILIEIIGRNMQVGYLLPMRRF